MPPSPEKTPVEEALPVRCDINTPEAAGRGGLVLVMHATEMDDGNRWQKEIAKLAIKKLSPVDMLGMIYYDGQHKWHIPFQTVGEKRARVLPGAVPGRDARQ